MNLVKRIGRLFPVMEDEVRAFRLLFLQSLFLGFSNSYYYIVSSSFLLKNVNVKILPNAYIITGTAGFLLIQLYKRLQKKFGITGSYRSVLIIFSLVCCMNFFAMMELSGNKAFSVFLAYFMVLFAAPFTAIFSLGLFAQCARLFNIAQAKRLLALVVSGEIISSVVAFMSGPFITSMLSGKVYWLLPLAGFFTLLVFVPFSRLLAFSGEKFQLPVAAKKTVKVDINFLRKEKFYTYIGITTLFSVFAIYVVDYMYLISVRCMKDISGFEIAEIVSVFFFSVKLGELVFSMLSGKILSSKGVMFSLLMLPVLLLGLSAFAAVSGLLFSGLPVFLLAFLFLAKLLERAVRKSVTTPSVKVMYQVAEPHERLEIESTIDGLLNQVATVVSGVLLLIVSLAFFHGEDDKLPLLKLFSFICIAAFAAWTFLSLRMYDSYREKISRFLLMAKMKVGAGGTAGSATAQVAQQPAEPDVEQLFAKTLEMTRQLKRINDRSALLEMVRVYNPRQSIELGFEKDEKVAHRLVHVYYNNNHYFSRLLIARTIAFMSDSAALVLLQELWEVSDLSARLELMLAYNARPHKVNEAGLFERLCEDCGRELTWAEACIDDTVSLKNEELDAELQAHRALLVRLLFELLKNIYEPSVVSVIYDIVNGDSGDVENRLFAVELLDITLHTGQKEIIKPLMEPVTFAAKKQRLAKIFHVYSLTPRERLVDILMKDYNLVSLKLKEVALVAYNKIAEDRTVLSAFRTNSMDNLKWKAESMYAGFTEPVYMAKLEVLKLLEARFPVIRAYSPYIFNYALTVPRKHKSYFGIQGGKHHVDHGYGSDIRTSADITVRVDYLGLALLLTLMRGASTATGTDMPEPEPAMEGVE